LPCPPVGSSRTLSWHVPRTWVLVVLPVGLGSRCEQSVSIASYPPRAFADMAFPLHPRIQQFSSKSIKPFDGDRSREFTSYRVLKYG